MIIAMERAGMGDYHLLEQFSQSEGFELQEIPVHLLDAVSVSSTRIREAIGQADIDTANQLLGYPYFFSGQVVEGRRLGRTIGYPTANLRGRQSREADPGGRRLCGGGIAAGFGRRIADYSDRWLRRQLSHRGRHFEWKGMMNIGMRPTIDGSERTIEVNIFDFNEDLYGREVRVMIRKWLRGEVKFNGLDALKDQLAKDKIEALAALGR